jgi:hypothetical protein
MCCRSDADSTLSNVSLDPIGQLTALEQLRVLSCRGVTTLAPLRSLRAVTQLHLQRLWELQSLHPLGGLTGLQDLRLEQCFSINDISPLHHLTALQHLKLVAAVGKLDQPTLASMLPGLHWRPTSVDEPGSSLGGDYCLPEWP